MKICPAIYWTLTPKPILVGDNSFNPCKFGFADFQFGKLET